MGKVLLCKTMLLTPQCLFRLLSLCSPTSRREEHRTLPKAFILRAWPLRYKHNTDHFHVQLHIRVSPLKKIFKKSYTKFSLDKIYSNRLREYLAQCARSLFWFEKRSLWFGGVKPDRKSVQPDDNWYLVKRLLTLRQGYFTLHSINSMRVSGKSQKFRNTESVSSSSCARCSNSIQKHG